MTVNQLDAESAETRHIVIVGAGVTGLVTAIGCALAGHRVTVMDRNTIPSPEATSFDQHRAVRALDPTDVVEMRRAALAHRRWVELETMLCEYDRSQVLYRKVGVVSAWHESEISSVLGAATEAAVPVRRVDPSELRHIQLPAESYGILELCAGVLLADRVLHAAVRFLARHPAVTLREQCDVSSVDIDTTRVTLADRTEVCGDFVLVSGGPWSTSLIDVPTTLYRQTMVYLRPPHETVRWWETAPSAGRLGGDGCAWLLPPGEGTLLKVSTDAVCREVSHPGTDDGTDAARWVERVMASDAVADIDRYTVAAVKQCHYAVDSRTGAASLEQVGQAVWVRAASGGDGFRTAPFVGDRIVNALSLLTDTTGRNTP